MKIITLTAIFMVTSGLPTKDLQSAEWLNFKSDHEKLYGTTEEELYRLNVFQDNLEKIEKHNKLYELGLETYTKGINQFGDFTSKEFLQYVNQYKFPAKKNGNGSIYMLSNVSAPESKDWRENGIVTPMKNQGVCGSCWSFSATGSLEGQYALKTGKLVSLSEQNLIDCSTSYGNMGCFGGWMDYAFQYVENNGIESESDYPYEAVLSKCRYSPSKSILTIKGFEDIRSGCENTLQQAVSSKGPISIAIDATENLQFYSSGYFLDGTCSSISLNHGVLVVGYGSSGVDDYWIVKNSWGSKWGEKGYIKMARNRGNRCGVATSASYPIL